MFAEEGSNMEWNDVYDENRNLTGRIHRRGSKWSAGEYGLVVCVWVHDGKGNLLMTRRAPQKSFPRTWENPGGAAQAGETSLQAVRRELYEETGILAEESEFEYLSTTHDSHLFYDHYCVRSQVPLEQVVLLPGETDAAKWVSFPQVHDMIEKKQICKIIAQQFLAEESKLLARQTAQE
jgi:mutator protein MutT